MGFLHPWALVIGIAAVGLPVLVHWLTRPRPRRLPLSTLRFVREAVHQRRAIHRLRDWIILSLRAAAVLLLAWAFSRPLIGDRELVQTDDAAEGARVVVLDSSQSMSAIHRGVSPFERGRALAADLLAGRPGQTAGLIFAGAQPHRVFDSLSANFAELRRELKQAQARPERCDVRKTIMAAADLLSRSPGGKDYRRELIVITDLQESNWKSADFSVLPEDTLIRIESVAAEQVPANVAVLRAGVAGRSEAGQPGRLEVEVGNYSDTPRTLTAEVTVGNESYRLEGLCPAGGTVVLANDITMREGGWLHGEARLIGADDALNADNVRSFVVEVRRRPAYALVTREEAGRRPTSSYYLECALSPEATRDTRATQTVTRVSPSQVNREALAGADLLIINRPGVLAPDAISLVAALVVRGKPAIYVASEPTDAANLAALTRAIGPELKMPVQFVSPSGRQTRRGLQLASYRRDVPPFKIFGGEVVDVVEPLRFTRGLDSSVVEGGLKDDVLATYSDGTAGLVWSNCGAGSLVVINADLAESNLIRSQAFVPLLGDLTGNLLAKNKSEQVTGCGESMTAWLPPEAGTAAGLQLQGILAGTGELGELLDEPAGVVWRWPNAGAPGVYQVLRDAKPVLAVATAVPAEESNLRPLPASSLADRTFGGRTVHYRAATLQARDQDDLWTWIAVACMAFMLVELIALRMFRT